MFYRHITVLIRAVLSLFQSGIFYISALIPKRKNLVLFSAWNGRKFSDNPKYMFQYVVQNVSSIDAYWFCKDIKLFNRLQEQGLNALYSRSLKGVWMQLRCCAVVCSHSVEWEFVPFLISGRVKRIQAWHGAPLKKIGYDDSNGTPRKKAQLINRIMPFRDDRCDLVFATGHQDKARFESAFNVSANNVKITGYARNDALRVSEVAEAGKNAKLKILYMPTYRGGVNSEFTLFNAMGLSLDEIERTMREFNIELTIRLHPVQYFNEADSLVLRHSNSIKLLNDVDDIYELLSTYDILMTDYSSIFFDFMITFRPIIMAPFLHENYCDERALYCRYDDVCVSDPVFNWDDLKSRIATLRDEKISDKYVSVCTSHHAYLDANSSSRCVKEMLVCIGKID